MHKKLASDLMSLAHSILQMKNKEDVLALLEKSKEIHEKLAVLAFVDEYIRTTPTTVETKEELVNKVENAFELKEEELEKVLETNKITTILPQITEEIVQVDKKEVPEPQINDLQEVFVAQKVEEPLVNTEVKVVEKEKVATLEDELKDTVSVDVIANLFENAKPKSLNDQLLTNIQIGLNDRIVFVKNLFNGSQEDYNRVVSQLNTFKNEQEAKYFINKMVKPDYNWSAYEELENRFIEIIERRFS
ncbi:hypothetical protein [Polaribacter sp.]|uniref:hypothetical protein n=1 Tax=Polaribacter sp. TaxID=1920175 RepID=UPI003EF3473E